MPILNSPIVAHNHLTDGSKRHTKQNFSKSFCLGHYGTGTIMKLLLELPGASASELEHAHAVILILIIETSWQIECSIWQHARSCWWQPCWCRLTLYVLQALQASHWHIANQMAQNYARTHLVRSNTRGGGTCKLLLW